MASNQRSAGPSERRNENARRQVQSAVHEASVPSGVVRPFTEGNWLEVAGTHPLSLDMVEQAESNDALSDSGLGGDDHQRLSHVAVRSV